MDRIADHIRDGALLVVRDLPDRYANLNRTQAHVTKILVIHPEKD